MTVAVENLCVCGDELFFFLGVLAFFFLVVLCFFFLAADPEPVLAVVLVVVVVSVRSMVLPPLPLPGVGLLLLAGAALLVGLCLPARGWGVRAAHGALFVDRSGACLGCLFPVAPLLLLPLLPRATRDRPLACAGALLGPVPGVPLGPAAVLAITSF